MTIDPFRLVITRGLGSKGVANLLEGRCLTSTVSPRLREEDFAFLQASLYDLALSLYNLSVTLTFSWTA